MSVNLDNDIKYLNCNSAKIDFLAATHKPLPAYNSIISPVDPHKAWEYFFATSALHSVCHSGSADINLDEPTANYYPSNAQDIDQYFENSNEYKAYLIDLFARTPYFQSFVNNPNNPKSLILDSKTPLPEFFEKLLKQSFPARNLVYSLIGTLICFKDISEKDQGDLLSALLSEYAVEDQQASNIVLDECVQILNNSHVGATVKQLIPTKILSSNGPKFPSQLKAYYIIQAYDVISEKEPRVQKEKLEKYCDDMKKTSEWRNYYEGSLLLAQNIHDPQLLNLLIKSMEAESTYFIGDSAPDLTPLEILGVIIKPFGQHDEIRKTVTNYMESRFLPYLMQEHHGDTLAKFYVLSATSADHLKSFFQTLEKSDYYFPTLRYLNDQYHFYKTPETQAMWYMRKLQKSIENNTIQYSSDLDPVLEQLTNLYKTIQNPEAKEKVQKFLISLLAKVPSAVLARKFLPLLPKAIRERTVDSTIKDFFALQQTESTKAMQMIESFLPLFNKDQLSWYINTFLARYESEHPDYLPFVKLSYAENILNNTELTASDRKRILQDLPKLCSFDTPDNISDFIERHLPQLKAFEENYLQSNRPKFVFLYELVAYRDEPKKIDQFLMDAIDQHHFDILFDNLGEIFRFNKPLCLKLIRLFCASLAGDNELFKDISVKQTIQQLSDFFTLHPEFISEIEPILKANQPKDINLVYLELTRYILNIKSPIAGDRAVFNRLRDAALDPISPANLPRYIQMYRLLSSTDIKTTDSGKIYGLFGKILANQIAKFLKTQGNTHEERRKVLANIDYNSLINMLDQDKIHIDDQPSDLSKAWAHLSSGDISYVATRAYQKTIGGWFSSDEPIVRHTDYHSTVHFENLAGYQMPNGFQARMVINSASERIGTLFMSNSETNHVAVIMQPGVNVPRTFAELIFPKLAIQTTGTYTSKDNKPTDFVIVDGVVLSYYFSNRDGALIIDPEGHLYAGNLKELHLKDFDPKASKDRIYHIFESAEDLRDFLELAERRKLSVLQGHLISFKGDSLLHANAKTETAERRVLVTFPDGRFGIMIPNKALSFNELAKLANDLGASSLFNLDTGTYDFMATYDNRGYAHVYGVGKDDSTTKLVFY